MAGSMAEFGYMSFQPPQVGYFHGFVAGVFLGCFIPRVERTERRSQISRYDSYRRAYSRVLEAGADLRVRTHENGGPEQGCVQ